MKSFRIVLLSSFVGLSILVAQEEPSIDAPAGNATPAAEATPTPQPSATPEASSQPDAAAESGETTEPSASPASRPVETDSAETAPEISPAEETATTETPTEIAPESTAADLPAMSDNPEMPDTSVAAGPDEPVPAPDTSFIEPSSDVSLGELDVPPDASSLPGPPRNIAEEERKERLLYQKIRIQALKDAAVVKALAQAEKAKTPEDYRAYYRLYYKLLYARIVQIDPSLKDYCELMEEAHIRRLSQSRILPTIPNNPPPR